jgi:hypothetical protein
LLGDWYGGSALGAGTRRSHRLSGIWGVGWMRSHGQRFGGLVIASGRVYLYVW